MEKIKTLLHQVAIINRKNEEILDATGGRFNIFQICGVNHYENTHSAILAEFLNPNGSHGLSSKLLDCFFDTLGELFIIQNFNSEKSRVRVEHSTEEGRIDILIEDNRKNVIIIENKIYANDQPEQLKRYNRYAQKNYNEYQIFYLTLFGDKATKQSGEGVNYLPISHKEHVINWLEKCVAIASRYPIVRETIIQYINHLKQLTNQDMDTRNKEEIVGILSNVENLKAAKSIYLNYTSTFNLLIEKYFNPKMEDFARNEGLQYCFDRAEESFVLFRILNSNWQDKYWITFTIENNRCYYGLTNNLDATVNYRMSIEERKIIHENLQKLGVESRKESDWWPFYAYYNNLNLETWINDIIKSDNFFNDCKEKITQLLIALKGIENKLAT